jgi:hypothetical protein
MASTDITQLPPGIYRIVVAGVGDFDAQRLTDGDSHVTIVPPTFDNDPKQEVMRFFYDELNCLLLTSPFT